MSISSDNEKGFQQEVASVSSDDREDSYPEGGLRAWMTMAGVFLVQFTSFGYTNAHGVYNDFYVRDYLSRTCTSAQISWIGSTQLFFIFFTGVVSGIGFDAGHFYPLMIAGSLLFTFSLMMISLSQPEHFYQVFLPQGLGLGIANGILYIPSVGILSHYFQKRRALAIGIAAAGSAVGGAVHPLMLNAWFHGSLKFHAGVRASAGLTGTLLIIALLLMKPRYPKKRSTARGTLSSFRIFAKDIPYVITVIGTALALAGIFYPIYFIQLNAIKNGISQNLAFYTITILNGASVFGRIFPNILGSKIGPFNVMISGQFILSLLVFCTLAIKNAAGTLTFTLLYGFFVGTYASGLPTVIASLASNDAEIGARLGVCFTFTGFGGLLGTPVAGALLSTSFVWWRPAVFSGLCFFAAAMCFLITRLMRSKEKGTQWL